MKKILLHLLILFATTLYASSEIKILQEIDINQLPEGYRIENDGIYGISAYDFVGGELLFKNFDSGNIWKYSNNEFTEVTIENIESNYLNDKIDIEGYSKQLYRDNTLSKGNTPLPETFIRNSEKKEITFLTPVGIKISISNTDYADLIGVDSFGRYIFLTEKITRTSPMKVSRSIEIFDNSGKIINEFSIPTIKFFYLETEFILTPDDRLMQLWVNQEKMAVVEYENYNRVNSFVIPDKRYHELHFNEYVNTSEYTPTAPSKMLPVSSRLYAVKLGEKHAELKYNCTVANLAYQNVTGPDGDIVRTPDWLYTGQNSRIPYKWGGFNTVATFLNGLANGRYAGDINTAGVSGYAVGNDCSGFVSRCWQLNEHYSTSMMPGITGVCSSWDDIKMGDAIHKVGHVRLYINRTSNGALRVVEAAGRNWDVSYWSFAPSDLSAYSPRYYIQMNSAVNENFAKLLQAKYESEDIVKLVISPQEEAVGYRVYISYDGETWYLNSDENSNTSSISYVKVDVLNAFFRVATVINSGGQNVEGFWSNILSAGYSPSPEKVLLVDGFARNYGSGNWQGYIHNFIKDYALYFTQKDINIESVNADYLTKSYNPLSNYNYIYWIMGDESTTDETLNSAEQNLVKTFLEKGGKLFVSGSEIGWDLYEKGSPEDKAFYNNYLKAVYQADDAGSSTVAGTPGSIFSDITFHIGQTYEEDYPDQVEPASGGQSVLKYDNGKGAGISFSGQFGNGTATGKVIYFGFPLESTADNNCFMQIIDHSYLYFNDIVLSNFEDEIPGDFILHQNYPNPFNPETTLSFELNEESVVKVELFNMLGEKVRDIFSGELTTGTHKFSINGTGISSGNYFVNFIINDKLYVQKISLLK